MIHAHHLHQLLYLAFIHGRCCALVCRTARCRLLTYLILLLFDFGCLQCDLKLLDLVRASSYCWEGLREYGDDL